MRAALLLLFALAALALLQHQAQAQEPSPTPDYPRCIEGMPGQQGGRTIAVDSSTGTLVTLPPGEFQLLVMPPSSRDFAICHIQTQALVTISRSTCVESSRRAPTAAADAVVDQIVASCRVPQQRPPQPYCHSGFYVSGGERVTSPRGEISLTLPIGDFIIRDRARGPGTLEICKVQANLVSLDYEVTLSTTDCTRIDAAAVEVVGFAAIEQILTSCVMTQAPIATPTATVPPTDVPPSATPGSATGTIRPPDTGNADLKD